MILLAIVIFVFCYFYSAGKERFNQINSLGNIPLSDCEKMCDDVYEYNQQLGRGMDADQSMNLRKACKTACEYTPFVRTGWTSW